MTDASSNPLLSALLENAGRRAPSIAPSETWRTYARFLFDARRRVLASPPCPTPVLRRVHGLFREHGEGLVASTLRLVFDSWRDAAPALRGAGQARDLRYEGEEKALDVRIEQASDGAVVLQLAAEPARSGLELSIERGGEQMMTTLDPTGFGEVRLPPSREQVVLVLRDGEEEVMRTPPLPGAG